jgi:diguanylate cyclase (GGDEF)-like protein
VGIHQLHIEHVALLLLCTLLTVANSWIYKEMKGIHWFSLYNVATLLGAAAVALRGVLPDFLSIVVGNLIVVVGYAFLFLSLTDLFGRSRAQLYIQAALIVIAAITMVEYGTLHPNTPYRLIAYSVVLGCQQVHVALLISRKEDGTLRFISAPMALVLAGLALMNLIRILDVYLAGAPADYLQAGTFLQSIVIANSSLQCAVIVAYVWLTAALLHADLERRASTDPLTGLLNRRAIESAAERTLAACKQANEQVYAITIDLDGFKQINDSHGHHCGDATLVAVARTLESCVRKHDVLARLGGDEFAILLPYTSIEAATEIAERLRSSIEGLEIAHGPARTRVTASLGLAPVEMSAPDWDNLLMRCDQALYAVKRKGGNGHSVVPSTLRVATEAT